MADQEQFHDDEGRRRKRRVLLVEDQAIFREPLASALKARGFLVSTAEDGREALQTLEMQLPDVLVLDLTMPKVDGLIVLARLRGNPAWQALPAIVLSAVTDPKALRDAEALGARAIFLKGDFSLDELVDTLEHVTREDDHEVPSRPLSTADTVVRTAWAQSRAEQLPGRVTLSSEAAGSGSTIQTHVSLGGPAPEPKRAETLSLLEHRMRAAFANPQTIEVFEIVKGALHGTLSSTLTASPDERAQPVDDQACAALVDLFGRYPMLRERVLAVANSGLFQTAAREFSTIEDVLRALEAPLVRGIILSCAIIDLYSPEGSADEDARQYWQVSLAVSAVMGRLLYRPSAEEWERLLLIGLCQDLPSLILAQQFPKDYRQCVERALREGVSVKAARKQVFGVDDDELFSLLLADINLPSIVTEPILECARFEAGVATNLGQSARLLKISKYLARALLCPAASTAELRPLLKADYAKAAGISPPSLTEIERLRDIVREAAFALAPKLFVSVDQARSPFLSSTGRRILYVRTRDFSMLDPVLLLLRFLGDTTERYAMPNSAEELESFDVMVVAVPEVDSELFTLFHCRRLLASMKDPKFKILYLAGNGEGSGVTDDSRLSYIRYPAPLDALADFVG